MSVVIWMCGEGAGEGGVWQEKMSAGDDGVEELQDDVLDDESGTWKAGTELAGRMPVALSLAGRDIV